MELISSISESFKDLGRWDIKKLSLINGIIWLFVWLILGYIFWQPMINFTTHLLNIMPFSFIKYSGAFIIYTILWIQAIFITVGIIFSLFNELVEKELEKTHFHYVAITAGAFIIAFWSFIFWHYDSVALTYIENFLKILPFSTVEQLMSIFVSAIMFYMLYSASISFTFLFFMIEKLSDLADEEYPEFDTNSVNIPKIILIICRDFILFLVGVMLLLPFMLIPFVNIFLLLGLWVFMVKDSYYNFVTMMFGESELSKKEVWGLSITSVILNFLPIINIFAPAFGVLNFYHYILEKKLDKGGI
jgi:hypothetical protein